MPKVSVVIPTFNRANYISEAIDSVLRQTFRDFEIIVVDDGSIDNTKDIIQNYKGKTKYFYQSNKGVCAARNIGIKEAEGEYVAFLDSDDIWFPEKLSEQVVILNKDKDVGLVASYMELIDQAGKKIGQRKPKNEPADNFEDAFIKGSPAPSTFLIRKECFKCIGMFDKDLKIYEDLDIFIKIAQKYKVININKVLGGYRDHKGNATKDYIAIYKNEIALAKNWISNDISIKNKKYLIEKIKQNSFLLFKNNFRKMKLFPTIKYFLSFIFSTFNFISSSKMYKNKGSVVEILFLLDDHLEKIKSKFFKYWDKNENWDRR